MVRLFTGGVFLLTGRGTRPTERKFSSEVGLMQRTNSRVQTH